MIVRDWASAARMQFSQKTFRAFSFVSTIRNYAIANDYNESSRTRLICAKITNSYGTQLGMLTLLGAAKFTSGHCLARVELGLSRVFPVHDFK